ncbi:MAG: glutathione S-transferase [Methyloceanibacter sp.]|jgi:glutathione S-transferase
MSDHRPSLITFGISPFCEKARWALDWHGIAYKEIGWPAGVHQILAKGKGAKSTTLPILLDGEELIQESSAIIDWSEKDVQDQDRTLTRSEALKVEQRADNIIGVQTRRLYYASMLPNFPHLTKPGLFCNSSASHRFVGNIMWPVTWRIIMKTYDITPKAAAESRAKLEAELDWLDSELSDGRSYLVGDRFSRADLTVSSLLAPFACPEEIPAFRDLTLPDTLIADSKRWQRRPVMRWVKEQYEAHRAPMSRVS